MALKKAGAHGSSSAVEEREDPDKIPASIPRHGRNGTPKIRIGDSAKFAFYKRASGYAKVIENEFLINNWKIRAAVFGTSRNAAIRDRLAAVPAFEDKGDEDRNRELREALQEIASDAMDVARIEDRAVRGTALHLLSEQADQGLDLSHLDGQMRAAVDNWRRIMARFTVHGTEQFVVVDGLELGGSYDRLVSPVSVMTTHDGTKITPDDRIVLDLKSGADAKYWSSAYRGQQAGYACGTPYRHLEDVDIKGGQTCRPGWPDGVRPHQGWALIPHIPLERPDDAGLVWVDLAEGRTDLELARRIHERRKAPARDVGFYEAELPALPEPSDNTVGLVETLRDLIDSAVEETAFGPLYDQNKDVWTPELTQAVRDRLKVIRGAAA